MTPLLHATDIDKQFGAVAALRSASFDLRAGEVHALLGENGAGKSTLARILAGSLRPDRGRIEIEGRAVAIGHPLEAQRLGIGIIYQELDLFAHLTVGENLVLGNLQFPAGMFLRQSTLERFCRPFLLQVGLETVDLHRWVGTLSLAEQQLVAIARALSMRCRILLMDEPTSALAEDAAERLFALIGRLQGDGVAIVYVSHKMAEIFRLCDRVTVLRDGETVGTRDIRSAAGAELLHLMVGREVNIAAKPARTVPDSVALSVRHLDAGKLRDVSFELHRGEVLGIAGLAGAGRSTLGAALVGLAAVEQGSITLNGRPFAPAGVAHAREQGLTLVPEDRKNQGLMMQMGAQENATLSILPRVSRAGFVSGSAERDSFAPVAARLHLRASSARAPVATLSGGNQQKSLLARSLLADTQVLFLDDPARGIDVAAKEDIYALIDELAAGGRSVLLASSELSELLRCADRIMVLSEGRVAGIFSAREATQQIIMAAAMRSAPAEPRPA